MSTYSILICAFLSATIAACGQNSSSYNDSGNITPLAKESTDNYSLSISNLNRSISFKITSISNTKVKITQLSITEGGANDEYDANSYPNISPIIEQNNLVTHWVTYLGGPEGNCPPFDFDSNINIQIDPQNHTCEVQHILAAKHENHFMW